MERCINSKASASSSDLVCCYSVSEGTHREVEGLQSFELDPQAPCENGEHIAGTHTCELVCVLGNVYVCMRADMWMLIYAVF